MRTLDGQGIKTNYGIENLL